MSKGEYPVVRGRTVVEAVLLCLLAAAVGLSLNFSTVRKAFSGRQVTDSPAVRQVEGENGGAVLVEAEPFPVILAEIEDLLSDGALLVDARNADDYRAGHLAGAVSLPLGRVDALLDRFRTEVPADRTLILYCSGFGCPDSHALGVRLIGEGYADVLVFEGGFPEWRDAGKAVERGEP